MPQAYVSLVDTREKALLALNEYKEMRYGTSEPIGEDEIREINIVGYENCSIILTRHMPEIVQGTFRTHKIHGAASTLYDIASTNESTKYGIAAEHMKQNRLKLIAWFAYLYRVNENMSAYSISIESGFINIDPDERMYMDKTNVEALLEAMVHAYPTRDDMRVGIRRFQSMLVGYEGARDRYLSSISEVPKTPFAEILKAGPNFDRTTKPLIEEQFTKLISSMNTNGLAARTWGFEVEVPDCKGVKPLAGSGIEKGDDGSLRSYESNDDCDCSCDDCTYHDCDCEMCDNRNDDPEHCNDSACSSAESAEYRTTGGIQRVKHNGLYELCKELNEVDAEMNDSAGTHIHVFAADLTTNQVGQVFAIYKRLENLFGVIAGRSDTSYASRIPIDYVRMMLKRTHPVVNLDKPRAINATHLFNDRGTLEFRQMDCNLNADRITAWAWLVRGLVEIAKRGAKLQDFMSVTNLQEVVEVYAKFNFFAHDEQPGLVIPGTRTDNVVVKRTQFARA